MTVKNCEKVEKSQVALTIEVDAAEFQAAIEKAYLKMRKKINVPGFRPGKAPRKMIETMYGAQVFFEEAINEICPKAYDEAVKAQELRVVGYPTLEMLDEATADGFSFKATIPVYPEVTLGQYKGLSAPKDEVKVTAAEVNERLKALQERNSRLVSVERAAKEGDTAVIDYDGYLDGKPFGGGKGDNYSLELGSHSFIPGFEEQVVGMKAGEEKDIDITFPEDYHEELAGKAVVFKVKCHEVKEKEVPEMDDEFAKDVSEFDTLKELKADIKKSMTAEKQNAADRDYADKLMNQVADGLTAEIPDAMVEAQASQVLDYFKMQMSNQGIAFEQYMQMTGKNEEQMLNDAMEPARHQVRMSLAVAAIAEAEKLEVTDADLEAEYENLSKQYGMEVDAIKKYVGAEKIADQIITQKATAVVTDSGTVSAAEEKSDENAEKPAKKAAAKKDAEGGEKPAKKTAAKKAAESAEKPAKKTAAKSTEKGVE